MGDRPGDGGEPGEAASVSKRNWKGGPGPGTLEKWLFELLLPSSEHRILELLTKSANNEDGCSWPSQAWLAHWGSMTTRNVGRIMEKLEQRKVVIVWRHNRRSNTYQVRCPELKLDDLARVRQMRGVDLAHDNLSGEKLSDEPADISGEAPQSLDDKPGPQPDPKSRAEVLQPERTTKSEQGPATPVDDVPDDPPPASKHGINFKAIGDEWNRVAEQCGLSGIEKIDKTREAKIRTRRADPEFVWSKICAAIYLSEGLHGQGWFTIDWLIANDNHWRRVLEMQYRRPKVRDGQATGESQTGGAMKELSDYGRGS